MGDRSLPAWTPKVNQILGRHALHRAATLEQGRWPGGDFMSQINDYMEYFGGPRPNCSICGHGPADAFWMADAGRFFVCRRCATGVFSKLLADTIANEINSELGDPRKQIEQALGEFEKEFHRAIVIVLCRRLAQKSPGAGA